MSLECKETCAKLEKNPGTVAACCNKYCASHMNEKTHKVEICCHLDMKCCAEYFAKTGEKQCPACAKAAAGTSK